MAKINADSKAAYDKIIAAKSADELDAAIAEMNTFLEAEETKAAITALNTYYAQWLTKAGITPAAEATPAA